VARQKIRDKREETQGRIRRDGERQNGRSGGKIQRSNSRMGET
jgi:hypothetical protein